MAPWTKQLKGRRDLHNLELLAFSSSCSPRRSSFERSVTTKRFRLATRKAHLFLRQGRINFNGFPGFRIDDWDLADLAWCLGWLLHPTHKNVHIP